MRKTVVILLGIINLLWALAFAYIILNINAERWYMKIIVLYPIILFFTFNLKFIDKETDALIHKITVGIYAVMIVGALAFILF